MPPKTRRKAKGKAVDPIPAGERRPDVEAPTPRVDFAPQILDQHQSVELMRIVTTAIISRIAFSRLLFPVLQMTYHLRTFDPADPDHSYAGFIRGDAGTHFFEPTNGLCCWKLLPRGALHASDKILDWLPQEIGVADALQSGYLERLQLTIHSAGDQISASNLIESYTLSFTYGEKAGMKLSSSSHRNNKTILLSVAKDQLYRLVSSVMEDLSVNETNKFVPLPQHCKINMNLAYNDTCPPEYQAPGFKAAEADIMSILNTSSTDPRLTMETPFHSVAIGWRIPTATRNPEPAGHVALVQQMPGLQAASVPCQRIFSNSLQYRANSGLDEGNTQAEAIRAFKSMGRSRDLSGSTRDTQPAFPLYTQQQTFASGSMTQTNIYILHYSDAINALLTQARMQKANRYGKDDSLVSCECGVNAPDENMIECELCGTLQHHPCYGYLDHYPLAHVCYSCLFQTDPDGMHRREEMKVVCLKRRALYYLHEQGALRSFQDLENYVGSLSIDGILESLQEEQYILPPCPKGKGREGAVAIKFIGSEQALRQNYFQPAKDIQDMLQQSNASAAQGTFSIGGDDASLRGPPTNSISESAKHTPTYSSSAGQETHFARDLDRARDADDSSTEGEPSSTISGSPLQQPQLLALRQPLRGNNSPNMPDLLKPQALSKKRKAPAAAPVTNSLVKKKVWNPAQARTPPNVDRGP